MALPTLTPEQRAAALAKAQEARKARTELLESVKSGSVSLSDVLSSEDAVAKKTKVTQLLKALPGYGTAKVAALLDDAGIDEGRRVGGLGARQRDRLLAAIDA